MNLNVIFVFHHLVRQEQELRNGGTVDKKLSTLADLFRPPIELMHKGSFETVRSRPRFTLHPTFIHFKEGIQLRQLKWMFLLYKWMKAK